VAANRLARLVGVTKQLLGVNSSGGETFSYRGSVGPLRLTPGQAQTWQRIGTALADEFDLQGLFGVDAVVDAQGDLWPIELNPRYTASVEILERGLGVATLGWHVAACRDRRLPAEAPAANGWHAKAVVYAPCDLRIGDEMAAAFERSNEGRAWPEVADLPVPGSIIRRGQPIVTVFAAADDLAAVEQQLDAREQEVVRIVRAVQTARRR
jgi:predicted ATP-grasp superfamily ATP-dependent carboligase